MIRKFIKNSSWAIGSNVISKVIGFVTLGFMARVLGPDQLGFYNAVQNAGNYINMMSSLGMPLVIQRTGAKIKERGSAYVSDIFSNVLTFYVLVNMLIACTIVLLPSVFFQLLLDAQGNLHYVYVISVIVCLNAVCQLPLYLIMGLEEFKKFGLFNLISVLLMLTISALFVWLMEDNSKAAYISLMVVFALNSIIIGRMMHTVIKEYALNVRLTLHWRIVRSMIYDGFMYFLGNTFLVAIAGLVTISLFYNHLTSHEYGFTRIGNAFSVVLSTVPAAIQPVTISMLSVENERNQYLKSLQVRVIPFFSTLILMVLALNMELILSLTFGPAYIGAKDIVFGMIFIQIPYLYLGMISNYQVGSGNLNYVGIVASLGCMVMIGGALYLIPRFGINGYFTAMYVSTFVSLTLMSYKEYMGKKQLSLQDRNSIIIVFLMIMASYIMMSPLPGLLRIPITILALILSGISFWKYCFSFTEKARFCQEWKRRINLVHLS